MKHGQGSRAAQRHAIACQSHAVLETFDGPLGSYEVTVWPAPRADRLLTGLLETGAVRLEGVRRVSEAVGLRPYEVDDAMKRVGVEAICIDGIEYLRLPQLVRQELDDSMLA